ncbi:MAG: Crp/Fnr family transcriptional regulator [Romboutsia sp.]
MFKSKTIEEILDFFKDTNYNIIKYNKNDIIALEDSPCTKVGLVLDGHVDIKRILTSNNVIHLSSFTRGNLFGEVIAFSNATKYPATVISTTPSTIMFIGKTDFIDFCTKYPIFLEMFLNELTNKIINLNKSITGLSLGSIRQKVSNFLINEHKSQDSMFIRLNMTKQKLAESIGVPRPSLSRELINMKEIELIDYSKDFIKILDLDGLNKILME